MAIKKTIEIDVVAPNAQQNINSVTTSLNNASKSSDNLNKTLNTDKGGGKFNGLKDSIGGLIPGFDKASAGASSFNKQLLVLLANPIGLVIGAIVIALTALFKAFQSTDEGADKLEQIMSGLSATIVVVRDRVIKIGGAILKFLSGDLKGAFEDGKAAVSGFGAEVEKEFKKAAEATKLLQEVEDSMVSLGVQRAKLNKNLAESKELLTDENATYAQKKKAIEDIRKGESEYTNASIENAKKRLRAAELETKLSGDERRKAIAEAQTALIELETESANINRSANKQERQLNAQIEADRKAKNDAEKARLKELQKARDEARAEERKKAEEELKAFKELLAQKRKIELDSLNASRDAIDKATEENINRTLSKDEQEIRAIKDKYFNLIEIARQNGLDTLELEIAQANEINDVNLRLEESKRAEAEKTAEQKKILQEQEIKAASDTFGILADLLGKQSKAGKAFAVAQALINTYQGITAGIKLGYPQAIPAVLAASVTGFKAVKDILKTDPKSSGASSASSSSGGGTPTATPQFNLVGQSSTNQLSQTIANQQKQPIKTYVVAGDVTTQQGLDRNAVQTSTFGG